MTCQCANRPVRYIINAILQNDDINYEDSQLHFALPSPVLTMTTCVCLVSVIGDAPVVAIWPVFCLNNINCHSPLNQTTHPHHEIIKFYNRLTVKTLQAVRSEQVILILENIF